MGTPALRSETASDADEARNAHLLTLSNITAQRLDAIYARLGQVNRTLQLVAIAGFAIAGAIVFAVLRR